MSEIDKKIDELEEQARKVKWGSMDRSQLLTRVDGLIAEAKGLEAQTIKQAEAQLLGLAEILKMTGGK